MLPNCIIIGAEKCGTTSLHHYMSFHPEIIMSKHKELNFFNTTLAWGKGIEWYKSQFKGSAKIYGEASPNYTIFPLEEGIAERMYSVVPDAKLIYCVRDPLERIISSYLDRLKGGFETKSLDEAIVGDEKELYIAPTKYYLQIEQYLTYYKKENMLVVIAEDLKNNRSDVLKKVFSYMQVDETFNCDAFNELKNVSDVKKKRKKRKKIIRLILGDYLSEASWIGKLVPSFVKRIIESRLDDGEEIKRPSFSQKSKEYLNHVLGEDLKKLRAFTGLPLSKWSI